MVTTSDVQGSSSTNLLNIALINPTSLRICENEDNLTNPSTNTIKKHNIQNICNTCDLDIIIVCETWFNDNVENINVNLSGYNEPVRCDRNDGYGGVAIYYSNNLSAIRVPELELDGFENVCIKITNFTHNIYVLGLYRSPSMSKDKNKRFLLLLNQELLTLTVN